MEVICENGEMGIGTAREIGGDARADCVAVILAAGAGSRFEGEAHKLNSQIGGVTIIEWAVRAACSAQIGPVALITGATRPTISDPDLTYIEINNPDWASGQASSVQKGIDYARSVGASAAVIGLGDQPFITAASWRALARSQSPIAVATYADPDGTLRRGNPVKLAASVWDALPTTGDTGARELIRLRPELVEAIPCVGSPADIDTMEDLQRWQNSSSTNSL
jgi:molybdenum cofactor cytidylyltransferase